MRGLPARLFGPTVKAVCWNIARCQRVEPATIYSCENSRTRG